MALINNPEQSAIERNEYMEDLAIEREDERLTREHEIRVLKLKQGRAGRYRIVEKVGITLVKMVPYCFAIMALTVLSLAKRDIPESLETFLAS